MGYLLFFVGLLGSIVTVIMLIINLIKKKPVRNILIALGISVVLNIAGAASIGSSTPADSEVVQDEKQEEEQEELNKEDKMKKSLDDSISGTFKGDNYSIDIEESEDGYYITINLDADRFVHDYWAGLNTTATIKDIKYYHPDIDSHTNKYSFNLFANGIKEFTTSFINNDEEVKIALIDKNGNTLPERSRTQYLAIKDEAEPQQPDIQVSPEGQVRKSVHEHFGEKSDFNDDTIDQLVYNAHDKFILIKVFGNENLTINMTKKGMWIDSIKVLKDIKDLDGIDTIAFNILYPLQDNYGNTSNGIVMKMTFGPETLSKINWDNFTHNNVPMVAEDYWEHPAIQK